MPSFKAFADFQKKTNADGGGAKAAGASPAAGDKPRPNGNSTAGTTPAAEAAPVPAKSDEPLKIGMKVKVCGLQARPELNGLEGVLTFFDDQRSRWQVELKNGGGAKLFKAANLEQFISDEDAMDILKGRKTGPVSSGPRAGAMGAAPAPAAAEAKSGADTEQALDGRPQAEAAKPGLGQGPSAAAVAAAAAVAKGGKAAAAKPAEGAEEEDDDDAFVHSIEQCLKECDVMWDDY